VLVGFSVHQSVQVGGDSGSPSPWGACNQAQRRVGCGCRCWLVSRFVHFSASFPPPPSFVAARVSGRRGRGARVFPSPPDNQAVSRLTGKESCEELSEICPYIVTHDPPILRCCSNIFWFRVLVYCEIRILMRTCLQDLQSRGCIGTGRIIVGGKDLR
jgi:hypothetical protein